MTDERTFQGMNDHDLLIHIATKVKKLDDLCARVEAHDKEITILQTHERVVIGVLLVIVPTILTIVWDLLR